MRSTAATRSRGESTAAATQAAGCKPDIYDDMLDYAHHWTSRGAVTKQVILEAFKEVVAEAPRKTKPTANRTRKRRRRGAYSS